MRQIFVRTPAGVVTTHGDLYTGQKDSFGREVFENDRIEAELVTEFGSLISAKGKMQFNPICGGFHFTADDDTLTELLNCDTVNIIKVLDEEN